MLGEFELFGGGEEEEETHERGEGTDDGEGGGLADCGGDGTGGDGTDDVGETDATATKTNEMLALSSHASNNVGINGIDKRVRYGEQSAGD